MTEINKTPVMMYIHGFMSGANGTKQKQLQKYFKNRYRVIAPELDADPDSSLAKLNEIIKQEKPEIIIGTSLGGWMTLMCDSGEAELVIVNPQLYHLKLFPVGSTNRRLISALGLTVYKPIF